MSLPQVLEDEILARVPPLSLARFRTVCQRWNKLFGDKSFIKRHSACVRPQFILRTHDSKIYSIGINFDDSLQVCELKLETKWIKPAYSMYQGPKLYENIFYCDGFLSSCPSLARELTIWNPWFRQETKWIKANILDMGPNIFSLYGLGYDNSRPDKCYKILGLAYCYVSDNIDKDVKRTLQSSVVAIYNFATNAWKTLICSFDWNLMSPRNFLSLNGTLYWIAVRKDSGGDPFVQSFDFSAEIFKPFCHSLPCTEGSTQVLEVFRGDRLSVLEQCMTTKKIKIWVTKNRIGGDSNEPVSWRPLMEVLIPDFPTLRDPIYYNSQPSYFIDNHDDKRLILCTCDETGKPYIYIVKEDRFKKIQIGIEAEPWPFHLVYVPSLAREL